MPRPRWLTELTAQERVTRVLAELGVRDRVQAVALAHEHGPGPGRSLA